MGFPGSGNRGLVGGAVREKGETYWEDGVVGEVGIGGKRVGVLGTGAPSRVSSDAGCWVWLVDSIVSTMISILSGRPKRGKDIHQPEGRNEMPHGRPSTNFPSYLLFATIASPGLVKTTTAIPFDRPCELQTKKHSFSGPTVFLNSSYAAQR